jgi:hypothetical protein
MEANTVKGRVWPALALGMNRPKLSAFPVLAAAPVPVVIYSPRDFALNVVIVALIILRWWP